MAKPKIRDITDLVNLLGGPDRAITLLGISRTLLLLWEIEGVPPRRWRQVTELLQINGVKDVTIDMVARIKPVRTKQQGKGRPKPEPAGPDQTGVASGVVLTSSASIRGSRAA
jgi:hypothetical protein